MLLEKLSPAERATYVLREAFDYSYREIAAVLEIEEANARQLAARARARLEGARRTRRTRTSTGASSARSSRPPRRATSRRSRRCWRRTS